MPSGGIFDFDHRVLKSVNRFDETRFHQSSFSSGLVLVEEVMMEELKRWLMRNRIRVEGLIVHRMVRGLIASLPHQGEG